MHGWLCLAFNLSDPLLCLLQYLDRIGQLFFGVPPKQTSSYGGLLGKPCWPSPESLACSHN